LANGDKTCKNFRVQVDHAAKEKEKEKNEGGKDPIIIGLLNGNQSITQSINQSINQSIAF
jgi:hypothetical protein